MSVYDITEHADFVFSAGDVVVRVAKTENENEAAEQGAERPTPCVGQVGVSLFMHREYSQTEYKKAVININISLHLAHKYARIIVLGHYLFRGTNSFLRA